MYPPPQKEIIQRLMHSDLDSVCFCRYVIHLEFENKNQLSFSAPFRFAKKKSFPDVPVSDFPVAETNLTRVLGQRIERFKCDTDGTLELEFSNGDVLIVYANDPAYEAYTLLIDEKKYIV